ncbi:MAG: hypothetical protein H7336_00320 [Bacteriovorax sp.]|nr:hypothetical protein [Bacteriovorax sp.]
MIFNSKYYLIVISIMGVALCYLVFDDIKAWDRVHLQDKFLKDTYAAARGISAELKNCHKKLKK